MDGNGDCIEFAGSINESAMVGLYNDAQLAVYKL